MSMQEQTSRRQAMRAYIDEQAALGLPHVTELARREWDRISLAIADLDAWTAAEPPHEGEWSIAQVVEHMHLSLRVNRERITTLYAGKEYGGPPQQPGSLPEQPFASFADLRAAFDREAAALRGFLTTALPSQNLQLTAAHAAFGDMNWLQWAAFLHVHARDHANQVEAIRAQLEGR